MRGAQAINSKPIAEGRTAEIYVWGEGRILKLFKEWWPAKNAEYEADMSRKLQEAGVAVPTIYDAIEVDGRRGIVYERIKGPALDTLLKKQPWRVRRVARIMAETHAAMMRHTVRGLPSQRERLERSVSSVTALPPSVREHILARLHRLPDGSVLCHGDLHPGNILLSERGPVVIDWENASLGSPVADVARSVLITRGWSCYETNPARRLLVRWVAEAFVASYLARYEELAPTLRLRSQVACWQGPLAAARLTEGIPSEGKHLRKVVVTSLRPASGDPKE